MTQPGWLKPYFRYKENTKVVEKVESKNECTLTKPCSVINAPWPEYPADHNRTSINLSKMKGVAPNKYITDRNRIGFR